MGLFEHFPYSNFHDLNLNWIISKVKNIEEITANVAEQSAAAEQAAADAAESAESAAGSAEAAAGSAQEAADTVEPFTSTMTEIRARMNAFVQQHSGPSDETLLYSTDTPVYSGTVALADSLSNYRNIKFVWRHRNDICEQEFKLTGSDGQNCWLRDTLGAAGTGGGSSIWEMCQMVAILGTGGSLQLSNATVIDNSGYNDGPVDSSMNTGILQVIGIRNVADTEVVDARVGSDNTVYPTLEDRLNAEYSALLNEIGRLSDIPYDVKRSINTILHNVAFKNSDVYTDELSVINAWASTAAVISITADFASSVNVYNTDSLDDLRSNLTVTAVYDDGTSSVINGYTLSGNLTPGTSTITVIYENASTQFTVTVLRGFRYTPAKGLLSEQSYINYVPSSTSVQPSEVISGDELHLTYPADSGWGGVNFDFAQSYTSSAKIKAVLRIISLSPNGASNTDSTGYDVFAIGRGSNMASLGFARYGTNTAQPKLRYQNATGVAWGSNNIALNSEHTLEITVENGQQTIVFDGATVLTSGPLGIKGRIGTGFGFTAHNSVVNEIYIKSIEFTTDGV